MESHYGFNRSERGLNDFEQIMEEKNGKPLKGSHKRGCMFSIVIWSEFRKGQYRDDDHEKEGPHFNTHWDFRI